jgi:hypothetical protein
MTEDEMGGSMRNAYKIVIGKSEGKRPNGRARRGWEGMSAIEMQMQIVCK